MKTTQWFRLDNVAKVFPVLAKNKQKNYFRLVFELNEPVDPIKLQLALEKTIKRFPTFQVRLRKGLFWYYFEQLDNASRTSRNKLFRSIR
jgi:predicted nucleic acid binding AN1-type Zn finger protein